jgi:beta-lactamase superfamily II metal-dependent hydrolase
MLNIHFLNVENGDCTILEHHNTAGIKSFGLIDCNRTPGQDSPALAKLKELGAANLSFVCVTHPDKDHFSGIYDVLTAYRGKIGAFYSYPLGPILADKELLKKYVRQIGDIAKRGDDQDFTLRHSELMQIIRWCYEEFASIGTWYELTGDYDRLGVDGFDGVEFTGIMPPKRVKGEIVQAIMSIDPKDIRSLNNNAISSAVLIHYGGKAIVLGGDATDDNWRSHRRFRDRAGLSISCDAAKLPHHGSRADNSVETLTDLFGHKAGGIAVISADGRRHPDFEIFDELDKLHCIRLCTNVCNPNENALKRLYRNEELSKSLIHFLNVYTEAYEPKPTPCKGDITVTVSADGSVSSTSQYNTVCGCTNFGTLLEEIAAGTA